MESVVLENVGPNPRVEVAFGDLTAFIGPRASGKSLFLKMVTGQRDSEGILEFKAETGKGVATCINLWWNRKAT